MCPQNHILQMFVIVDKICLPVSSKAVLPLIKNYGQVLFKYFKNNNVFLGMNQNVP